MEEEEVRERRKQYNRVQRRGAEHRPTEKEDKIFGFFGFINTIKRTNESQ